MSIPINFSMDSKKDSKTVELKEEKKEPKNKVCFISDYQMPEDMKNMLRSFSVPFIEAETNLDLLYNNEIILIGKDYFKNLNLISNLTKE